MTRSMTSLLLRSAALAAVAMGTVTGCDCGGEVRPVYPKIDVTPVDVVFGPVPVGAASEMLVEVRNSGQSALDITSLTVTENEAEIAVARAWEQDCSGNAREGGASLIGGDCARFAVRIKPTGPHAVAGKIVIESNDTETPAVTVNVSGTGVVSGVKVCVVVPAHDEVPEALSCSDWTKPEAEQVPPLDFGAVPLNDELVRKVRIFNAGEGPLVVTNAAVEVGDVDSPDFALKTGASFTATIAKAGEKDVELKFTPLGGDGKVTATFVIPTNDPLHPIVRVPLVADVKGPRLCVLPETGLDFGSVIVNTSRSLTLTVKNCGYVPYSISRFEFNEDDTATNEFRIDNMPVITTSAPRPFAPGDEFTLNVTYTPKKVTPANGAGDTGRFTVQTDYQRGTVPVVGKGQSPGCGTGTVPVANIKVFAGTQDITSNPQREPLDTVTLDGGTSTVGAGRGSPIYVWRLVSQPANGTTNISGSGARPRLFLELAGDYVVELVVKDQYDCQSEPKTITVRSVPKGKLHIQLTWPESFGDIDLHYLGPGGTFFDHGDFFTDGSDVFYMNKTPDWGRNSSTQPDGNRNNDASLDIDTLWGNGPENINHDLPFDGTFKIVVHHYCSRQYQGGGYSNVSSGPSNARVKVYVNGLEKLNVTKSITQRDIWEVASVVVSGGGTNIQVNTLSTPTRKTNDSQQGCTSHTN